MTEVLREGTGRIAPSVREAVLSRARHLPEPARRILDLASVVPEKLELPLLRLAHGPDLEPLHACLDRGLLVLDAEKVSFRHELARIAVEDALPPLRRADLHGRILAALARDAPDADTLNRLAHHAVSAGDGAAIVRYIPDAARVATRRGSHREAFALLTAAVPHAELLAPRERAQFFDQRSHACFLIEQGAEAFGFPWWMEAFYCRPQLVLIRLRQGKPCDAGVIDRILADDVDARCGTSSDRFALHRSRMEIAWLAGDESRARESAAVIGAIATGWGHPWSLGESELWNRLVGASIELSGPFAAPYALQFAGDWRGAAGAWRARGFPYEEGLALMAGDADGEREAIRLFESLGARAVAERVRDRMRREGVAGIPRGPQERHRGRPAGLTEREAEILALLATGATNAELAERLHRSVRTIENHVAALINKLGAKSRHDAVAKARARGLLAE